MKSRTQLAITLCVIATAFAPGCAYFNTLYNAKQKYREAIDLKRQADPEREKISQQEEKLYTTAFEKAARVIQFYPNSKWVDDAVLLMGKASFEKGEYSTAERKFDELLTIFPESNLVPESLLMKARTQVATKNYVGGTETLARAKLVDKKEWRDDVIYLSGLVQDEQGNEEDALAAYVVIVDEYEGSEWFADAALRAGDISRERADFAAAISFYEKARSKAKEPDDRFLGGLQQGEMLLEAAERERASLHGLSLAEGEEPPKIEEYKKAEKTFREVAGDTIDEEKKGEAMLRMAEAIEASGNRDRAFDVYAEIIEKWPRRKAAAGAQYAIGRSFDREGDFERAVAEYELVKEQGTGHPASQEAAARQLEIQNVLDLRTELATDDVEERERKRYLLAEQLLEKVDDPQGAVDEYRALSQDAAGTEWGARSLYATAWVLENRLDQPDSADVLWFELANKYAGTEADASARRRLGYPVWRIEEVDPGPIQFIRPEGESAEPEDIAVNRLEPRDVPLPEGETRVEVWVRLALNNDGTVQTTKVVKSGGEEFDAAVLEAARASTFVGPDAGGPAFTVQKYSFPVGAREPPATENAPIENDGEGVVPPELPEGADGLLPGANRFSIPPPPTAAPPDSGAAATKLPSLRDNDFNRRPN